MASVGWPSVECGLTIGDYRESILWTGDGFVSITMAKQENVRIVMLCMCIIFTKPVWIGRCIYYQSCMKVPQINLVPWDVHEGIIIGLVRSWFN